MEVDLRQLRTKIEKKLRELEQRKSTLKKQITHIEAVERIACWTIKPREVEDQVTGPGESESGDSKQGREGKSWFRR